MSEPDIATERQTQYDPQLVIDEDGVEALSVAMTNKLAETRKKGRCGWDDPNEISTDRLKVLLFNQLAKEPADVVDIANYCMMLYSRGVRFV
jgi:hypothetical protein